LDFLGWLFIFFVAIGALISVAVTLLLVGRGLWLLVQGLMEMIVKIRDKWWDG